MLLCEGLHDCLVLHHLGLPNQSIGNAIDRYRETFFYWSPKKFLVFDPKSKKRKVKFHFFGRDFAFFTFFEGPVKKSPCRKLIFGTCCSCRFCNFLLCNLIMEAIWTISGIFD